MYETNLYTQQINNTTVCVKKASAPGSLPCLEVGSLHLKCDYVLHSQKLHWEIHVFQLLWHNSMEPWRKDKEMYTSRLQLTNLCAKDIIYYINLMKSLPCFD